MNSKRVISIALLTISFLLGTLSIILVKLDPQFTHVWLSFWLHIASFMLIIVAFFVSVFQKRKFIAMLHEKEVLAFGGIFILAIAVSFFQLTMYPYSSLGDEVRDSGLYAQQIATHQTQNIFAYGAYDGYGLIVPDIASLFYQVFGTSVLTYRFPAAVVSVLDIVILYILLRQITSKRISALGASLLAVLPMHLFFARTHLVVVFNSFWTTCMLFGTYLLFETNSAVSYILLGSLFGFSSEFHATTRVISILLFLLTVLFKGILLLRKKIQFWPTLWGMVLLIVFAVVSFGPQLLFSTTENFFHTGRFVLQKNLADKQAPSLVQLGTIGQNYIVSLGSWIVSPVGGDFFHDDQPLVPFFFIPLFFLGIGYGVGFVRKTFVYILCGLLFLIPFFSSAITDAINSDQRMNSALPIVAIFCSIGIYVVLRVLKKKYLQWGFLSLVGVGILFLGVNFFINQTADIGREVHQYMSMNMIYAIQNQVGNATNPQTYCLVASKENATNFDYLHYKEQYQYFLPQITLQIQAKDSLEDNVEYLYKGVCLQPAQQARVEEAIVCNGSVNFMCPRQWTGELKLYSE